MLSLKLAMFDKFLSLINHYVTLNEEEVGYLCDVLVMKQHKKGEPIFSEGQVARTIYFVLEGCVRLFYNVDGTDKTAFFFTEGKFICAGASYTFGTPARENYQAVENSVLVHLDRETTDQLLRLSPKFELIARIATEDELITSQQLIASFITLSPEERYTELLRTNGELFRRVPQRYIASFLGISPETLSRIKRRVVIREGKRKS